MFLFLNSLNEKWGKKILWHIEAVSQQGVPRLAALPVIKWTTSEELNQKIFHQLQFNQRSNRQ